MEKIKTFILCANQEIIFQSIEAGKYSDIGDYAFLFLGAGNTSKVEHLDNVIICRNLPNNIEDKPNWLIYTGWYALYHNNLLDGLDRFRVMDYDIDIIKFNNETKYDLKSSMGFDFGDHFFHGFPNVSTFIARVEREAGCSYGELIANYREFCGQSRWFSGIDMLISVKLFRNFMKWFEHLYVESENEKFISHHLERWVTVYLMLNKVEYEICQGESHHLQLKGHKYYY